MEVREIESRMEKLNSKLDLYTKAVSSIDDVKEEMISLSLELDRAKEEEKNNPWLASEGIVPVLFKGDKEEVPILKVYPYVKNYLYGNDKGYTIQAKRLLAISNSSTQPFKYKSTSKAAGKWCSSFRVRKKAWENYLEEVKVFVTNQIGESNG